jgi:alanyl aminopeptidase
LYAPAWRALGWSPRPDEDADRALYRRDLAGFLGLIAEDPAVRGEGARRGADYLAGRAQLPTELIAPCLAMHLRGADVPAVDAVITRAVTSDDALERFRLLGALGHSAAPALVSRVLPLALDPRLRVSEVFTALNVALERGATRDAAFTWLSANADAVFARISVNGRAGTPWLGARFCDRAQSARVDALFGPRTAAVPGSEAQLRGALEAIAVCAAEREAQGATLAAAFARQGGSP